jgi:hypothetical protein
MAAFAKPLHWQDRIVLLDITTHELARLPVILNSASAVIYRTGRHRII